MNHSSRRTFLRGAGLTLALPLFQRDFDLLAATARTETPMRMVCVANPLGFVADAFFPEKAGRLDELSPLLRPMVGLESQISVFSNLDHGVSGGHQAVHSFLSGIRDNESAQWSARNLTVDQRAAELGLGKTRFSSIVASVGANSGELECRTSWTRTGVNIPPITELQPLFEALFVSENAEERKRSRIAIKRHSSVLDAIRREAKSLHGQLGQVDREKLEEYLTSIRSVEVRLGVSRQWLDKPKPNVAMKPPEPNQAFTKRLPLFYDLIRLALITDSTRVASLSIPGNLPVGDLGLGGNYHAFSHHGKTDRLLKPLFTIEQFQIQQLARFLGLLRDAQQPDGKTLLDHTMVLAGSGMGNASSHSNRNLPILLAGGGMKHGFHHVMPAESHQRVPLGNLFTSMLHQFGDHETGEFNRANGDLDEVLL
ncbi:MAG: DUF1552 domain-containing protein [Planctomycetota bacterium]